MGTRTRRGLLCMAVLGALGLLSLLLWGGGPGSVSRAASAVGEASPETDASVPARDVMMIGSSPQEAPGETWGVGLHEGASTVVRYAQGAGWRLGTQLLNVEGKPLSGFLLDHPEGGRYPFASPLAGQMTPDGSGVLAGTVGSGSTLRQVLLVRHPSGAFQETEELPQTGEASLAAGEKLLSPNRAPMIAALEEGSSQAGALVVPVDEESGIEQRVLHWNGETWSSEPIEIPAASAGEFHVLAIGASSPKNAWLLGSLSGYPAGSVALFHREEGGGGEPARWKPVASKSGGEPGEPLEAPLEKGEEGSFTVPNPYQSQVLTVTAQGVWIDGLRPDVSATTTLFFKPGAELTGTVSASWCQLPEGSPAGTTGCRFALPAQLSNARVRSYAWANAGEPYGERVITGFRGGVSLRLVGSRFLTVRALGGGTPPFDVGGTFGSAFSSAVEGWLGNYGLPVHLTTTPQSSRLKPWPVAFSHALLAVAPAPGQPVGATGSEALAVGDSGEVARYAPGQGWLPETLLGPGGRHENVRLRAVAWPTTNLAFAVGDFNPHFQSSMWRWRGETKLWEPDPATPQDFRGNLLGIAFDPNEPARGYAVGQSGVLLSYGKTWTQEQNLPAQVVGANFTSIAFAGSEAIVAYRKLIPSTEHYEGGLLINSGSGWHIDAAAAGVIAPFAPGDAPWAVAALSDGGAAFSTDDGQIFERQSAGGPWQATATPYPGANSPGSLAIFREGAALRVIAVGSVSTHELAITEDEAASPPGEPPPEVSAYPISSSQEQGVLRETATGWSDEEHELNNVQEPEGEYAVYDSVYQPDPVSAILVDPTGATGWALGGIVDSGNPQMDTSDVWRYPATGEEPPGVGHVAVSVEKQAARFLIGGGSQCEAPCADRANAKIGPDTWLTHALGLAGAKLPSGAPVIPEVRAFLYTDPRVTTGRTAGPATLTIPYASELERYADLLASSPVPAYAAPSPTDLDLAHSEVSFKEAFSGFPEPFGTASPAPGLQPACSALCQSGYYALETTGGEGGTVRVIVLDQTSDVSAQQLAWLRTELAEAETKPEPAIVVGNANLAAQSATDASAREVIGALVAGHASAYFFDSPEQNLEVKLGTSLMSYGSGTLGYVSFAAQKAADFLGPSGVLLVQVAQTRSPATGLFPVHVKLIPNIGELALEAEQGTLLRRSEVAEFEALARRPRSGNDSAKGSTTPLTDPYVPIPFNCRGTRCAENEGLFPEYTFRSSEPKVGAFVKPDLAVSATTVERSAAGKPILDAHSGLFCAFAKGETDVTVEAGGLSATVAVVVQGGSLRQPCVPPTPAEPAAAVTQSAAPAPPPASPAPAAASPAPTPVPIPVPPPPATPVTAVPVKPQLVAPFFVPQTIPSFVPGFVPPPIPTPARPTPPSGTSAVTSPVEAPERQEEEEAAPESVSNEALAYHPSEHEPMPEYLLGVIVLAAFAGASVRRRPGRRRRGVEVAPATISAMRTQRRHGSMRRRGR